MLKWPLCVLLLFASAVVYADNCERPRNVFDELYCARKIFFDLDDDLNKYYKLLTAKLTWEQKKLLKKGQIAWINDRDSSCTRFDPNGIGSVVVSCAVKKTRERLHFLQERYRECKTIGCITSRLEGQ